MATGRKSIIVPDVGHRFGNLVVTDNGRIVGKRKACECRCDCGKTKVVRNEHLVKGSVRSCGCLRRRRAAELHRIHGGKGSRLYRIWKGMRERCYNKGKWTNAHYQGRGIVITPEWNDFSKFREWALTNGYHDDLTIDRIDNDKGYAPNNCRWADRSVQSSNRRTAVKVMYGGREVALSDLARAEGISYGTLYDRLKHGRPLVDNKQEKEQ